MMLIRIDSTTGAPIWQQIVLQVTRQAMSGSLAPGERLPTVRELALQIRINPNTAARAYQELERDGIVETRRGAGTFVCDIVQGRMQSELKQVIESRFDGVIVEAIHLKLDRHEINRIFIERLETMMSSKEDGPDDKNND